MPASVRPAMEAGDRTKGAVETRDEAIGPARRPWLHDPELLDAALLCRLQRRPARAKAGRHPVVGVDFVDHATAIAVFAQHELDELAARRKQREPDRSVRAPRQPARDRREGPPAPARRARRRPAKCASTRSASFRKRRSNRHHREDRSGRPDSPAICVHAPLAGSSRHTEPEAPFSMRSRFQSAGP